MSSDCQPGDCHSRCRLGTGSMAPSLSTTWNRFHVVDSTGALEPVPCDSTGVEPWNQFHVMNRNGAMYASIVQSVFTVATSL